MDLQGGLIGCEVVGGYESTPGNGRGALDDGFSYTFTMCEFCLDDLFTQFVLPVRVRDRYFSNEPPRDMPWKSAKERVNQDAWREQKDIFMTEYQKRKKARESFHPANGGKPKEGRGLSRPTEGRGLSRRRRDG